MSILLIHQPYLKVHDTSTTHKTENHRQHHLYLSDAYADELPRRAYIGELPDSLVDLENANTSVTSMSL